MDIFNNDFMRDLDDLCNVVTRKVREQAKFSAYPLQNVIYPGKIVYYIDHGQVRERMIKKVRFVEEAYYRGTLPKYQNTYYGSSQRNGFLYNIQFNHGDPISVLVPENKEGVMYTHSSVLWYDKNEMIRHLTKRLDTCGMFKDKYQKKVDYFTGVGDGIVRCLNQLDADW